MLLRTLKLFLNRLSDAESKFVDCALVREEEIEQAVMHRAFLSLLLEVGTNHDIALAVLGMLFISIHVAPGRSPLFEL